MSVVCIYKGEHSYIPQEAIRTTTVFDASVLLAEQRAEVCPQQQNKWSQKTWTQLCRTIDEIMYLLKLKSFQFEPQINRNTVGLLRMKWHHHKSGICQTYVLCHTKKLHSVIHFQLLRK